MSCNKKIRYGIVGFGGIAENRIAKEGFACDKSRFQPLENAELIGVTDINPARKAAAEAYGLKFYASMDEMYADPEIDAVFIATNNTTHASAAMAAMKAGKHVISEKPLCTRIEDGEKMISAAAEYGLSLSVDHMMVKNARNELAREYIRNGKLGVINDAHLHMEFEYGYNEEDAKSWRCSKIEEMGGPIGDVASHCFYMAEFLFDSKIVGMTACYYPKQMKIAAEDGAYIRFDLANGLQCSASVAFCERRGGALGTFSNLGFEIYGSEGVLRSFGTMFQFSGYEDEPYKIRLELETADGVQQLVPEKVSNIYQGIIEDHAESIKSGKLLNAESGLDNLKYCLAAHKSASNGGVYCKID